MGVCRLLEREMYKHDMPLRRRRARRTFCSAATVRSLRAVLVPLIKDKLPQARIIVNREGRTPHRQHVLTALKNLLRRFGLRERSFHSLRHYFCSKLVSCGASVEAVRLLGRSDLAITQRYVHALGNDLKDAIAKLSG